jgi:hypothetical protein
MIATPLSTAVSTYSEFIWWWLHHSDDESRVATMLGSYYDESAIDGSGPVSVVGGLGLLHPNYTWLGIEWKECLAKNEIKQGYLHMKDFGEHGSLHDYPTAKRHKLFAGLTKIINEHKQFSIGSTLSPDGYRNNFSFMSKKGPVGSRRLSIHSLCFLHAAVAQAYWAEAARYESDIPFMLDEGCPDRTDVDIAHKYLREEFPADGPPFLTRAGGLTWEDDKKFPSLQAADVISWTVRRKAANKEFDFGYEPLIEILDEFHYPADFDEGAMKKIAMRVRTKFGI